MEGNEQSSDGIEETVMTLEKYIQVLTTDAAFASSKSYLVELFSNSAGIFFAPYFPMNA